jgi:GNAT superfamily N-acetyltransferase
VGYPTQGRYIKQSSLLWGVGKTLALACEQCARNQGYRLLSLATDAANERALGFYRHMGYQDEDVTLVKLL